MNEFRPQAPSAETVFYRTYSRRKTDGTRENFREAMTRTVDDLARIGGYSVEEHDLVMEQALKQRAFPSGRAFWVAGTDWSKRPENFSGYYNCTSTHIGDLNAFGLLVDLAMQGSGTGAVLEQEVIDQLPEVQHHIDIVGISPVGGRAPAKRDDDTSYETLLPSGIVYLKVGDSRQGWRDAYQFIINLAHRGLPRNEGHIRLHLDLSNVRPSGERLKGFGGTSNPVKLEDAFLKVVNILNGALGRKLTTIESCLLIDEAATAVVAGNIRRSAGMRQFSQHDQEAATAKLGLYSQDQDGNWRVDPGKEALRMANHTRCYHTKPTLEEIKDAVSLQFTSGEGAIQYVPEAIARANADLFESETEKKTFLDIYEKHGRKAASSWLSVCAYRRDYRMTEHELAHRMDRYGLNPCFAPGTIVMTRDGYQPIEALVGKVVEIHDGNEWRTIDNFRVTANDQDVYDLELHDGTIITATEYHKFILADGRRVELKDLKEGDELMAAKVEPVKGTIQAKGAYLKGFLVGDGTSDKGRGAVCKVYAPKKVCLDRLTASQAELGMIHERRANGHDVGETGLTPAGYLKGLTATSEDLNPWCYAYKHEFPYEVLNWTDEAKFDFIAGLFDADGTARDGGTALGISYQITSVSRPFLQGLVTLLRTLGIASKIGPARAGGLKDFGTERGGVYAVKPTYRLHIGISGSIKLAQGCVFERLKSFADRTVVKPQKSKANRVKSITFSHNAPEVFCCTVPTSSAFTLGTLHLVSNCGEIIGRDFHCNLAEVHLNTIDPSDYEGQKAAFYAAGLQVAALLQHQFVHERYQYSREIDPIVGVSFTGLFDFLVHAGGYDWLKWMMGGRKGRRASDMYVGMEQHFLMIWRDAAHRGVKDYCKAHGLRVPNRITTVQPAGTKSLLTGASSGWHAPKSQRFIRRITLGVGDPLVPALIEHGYSVIPAQSARDDDGNLLDDISDPRVQEVLVEIPTEVSWANLPGCDEFDLAKLPVEAQYGLYMQVQRYYTDHNTSATIELRENEIETLSKLIYETIQDNGGYISAALLARFDVDGGTYPRLPFEPISKERYDELMAIQEISGETDADFLTTLNKYDSSDWSIESVAGCTNASCLAKADADEREGKA